MEDFTTEELANWIDSQFVYELQPGEITAARYAQENGNMTPNTAAYRLNKMVKAGLMASKRVNIAGKNTRVFYRIDKRGEDAAEEQE